MENEVMQSKSPVDRLDEIIADLETSSEKLSLSGKYATGLKELQNSIQISADEITLLAGKIAKVHSEMLDINKSNIALLDTIRGFISESQKNDAETLSAMTTKLLDVKNDMDLHSTNVISKINMSIDSLAEKSIGEYKSGVEKSIGEYTVGKQALNKSIEGSQDGIISHVDDISGKMQRTMRIMLCAIIGFGVAVVMMLLFL